ncbi:hypothetical protein [Aeromonas hydrophila]|uniref:hypothetical protein n=1 Tax=Aeromonas hydrophila TaxID=644 RepID=UPI001A8DFF1E|nr:hypothetical protein [Aeromonas hydrophila]MBQ4666659.1 hypothetical protein [Aeromonas hydrophila]MBQ4714978.1 hypothetical protein [Aeromonas hydrophila]MBW3823394.1 hypothetical protein [Aeromonas hydrophila]MBW5268375.1 hypothetical protein [Aeromonas hydrophila]QSR51716.1 hypothetical protein GO458_10400 [Aeromonas hydrophila]
MENITFSECIYSGSLWGMLNEKILTITILAIFGCSMLSKWAIRDVINKRVNKYTWFALVFFSLTLLFSGTLLEGKTPDLLSEQCGSYAEIGIKFIVKMFDVFLLGILLLTTSFLMANRITEGQEKRNVDIQNKIYHQALSTRKILIIIITTALATNISTWIVFSIIS